LRWTNSRATRDEGGYLLNGCKVAIDGGGKASDYLVSARTAGEVYDPFGHSVFLVPRDAPGLRVRAWRMNDGSDMAAIELDGVRVAGEALLGEPGEALGALSAGMDAAIVANAFGVVGVIEAALAEVTLLLHEGAEHDEAMPDPRFLRQGCAEMLAALEQARSAAMLGLTSLTGPDGRRRAYATSAAKAVVVRASDVVCRQALQLTSGMGVRKDGYGDLFFRLAAAANSLRGSLDFHLSRMAMFM
jgi:alkylation response protein AidB-like acyl-CoA dehydrogenase